MILNRKFQALQEGNLKHEDALSEQQIRMAGNTRFSNAFFGVNSPIITFLSIKKASSRTLILEEISLKIA